MHKNIIQKLGLGTVQFGIDYGISNKSGQTAPDEVQKILNIAIQEGVKIIDTAHLYGNSEDVLGEALPADSPFNILTKTICFRKDAIDQNDCDDFEKSIQDSLSRLKQEKIYGLLLHHADDLFSKNGDALFNIMKRYKNQGIISKIGASVYDAEQIDRLLQNFDIDIIQLPLNIFDQRLIESGHLAQLKKKNIEIHVRSAFLQGIIFMEANDLPNKLSGLKKPLQSLHDAAKEKGITPMQAALAFLLHNPDIDHVICGVNNGAQFQKLCDTVKDLPALPNNFFTPFVVNDPLLINPANW